MSAFFPHKKKLRFHDFCLHLKENFPEFYSKHCSIAQLLPVYEERYHDFVEEQ